MNETAKNDVEIEEEVITPESIDGTGSSPVEEQIQEIDFASMSQEELVEFARKEHEAKQNAISHLRDQSKKRRPDLESINQPEKEGTHTEEEQEVEKPEESEKITNIVESIVEKKFQEKLQEFNTTNDYSKGSTEWLMQQSWATPFLPETPGSDPLYAKLFTEAKRLSKDHSVKNADDYKHLIKLAAAVVTGKPDSLLEERKESDVIQYQRSMSTSPSISSGKPTGKQLTKEEIEFAIACGHDPKDLLK